ncbi:MAG: leucine--tRNA ligase [Bacteroidetes bacterium]|nr:leucine--tRNA ligase [Bacteroidota bacterium]
MDYNFREVEKKWQAYWSGNKVFKAEIDREKPKFFVLDMFPYPSGAGLHVGHPLGYIASDIYARYKRLKGFNVLHPMGYDAYGLPAEQYAIQTGTHPAITTEKNIARYREQLDKIGFSFDWDREVRTSDPAYYKWTQWVFIKLFHSWYNKSNNKAETISGLIDLFEKQGNENIFAACSETAVFSAIEWKAKSETEQQEILMNYRLAYLAETAVNWCPALGTVLANDEVSEGFSVRGGHPVEKKNMKQWLLRITAYAERLLNGLETIDWSESIKEIQRNWIGRSEGASVRFKIAGANRGEGHPLTPSEGGGIDSSTGVEDGSQRYGYMTANPGPYKTLREYADNLRQNPTEAEALVWEKLRAKKTDFKFRRQHNIGNYIVDFVCLSKKTIIEVDGKIHDFHQEQDEARTIYFESIGFEVLRFTIEEVLNNIEEVITKIVDHLKTKVLPSGEDLGWAELEIFTTRPDTIFGVTFMVLAPEHPYVDSITTAEQKEKIEKYVSWAKNRSERERMTEVKKVSGEFTGAYAINPLNNIEIPIYVADYVLMGYGTGAIMAVPGHDSRDFAFARHFNLPIVQVVCPKGEEPSDTASWEESLDSKEGTMINSGFINGMDVKQGIKATIREIEAMGIGYGTINFRLRDAIFSRQRYWGEPFPVYFKDGMPYTLSEDKLPLELPEVDAYLPTESGEPPLARAKNWRTAEGYSLETNTMPGFAGSSAYYLRYMDPGNSDAIFSTEAVNYWKNVDLYIGGSEHATGHLLYARFWNKFLFDMGLSVVEEPFQKLINQGMIQGRSNFVYRVQGSNSYVSLGLKDNYEFQPLHVDVNIVHNDILDLDAFRKWQPQYADAEFILEDGKYHCGWEVEKMSKSKHNVQNPDDLIEKYGADTLRMYEMFLGPLEQSKPWDTNGIEGVSRFIRKFWRLFHDEQLNFRVSDETPTPAELKVLHKTIKKIQEDIERFSFNTAVSTFMICTNELADLKCSKRAILQELVILISSYAPHIADELWYLLGNQGSACNARFPEYKAEYTVDDTFTYPVSFNGKTRFMLEMPADTDVTDVEKAALSAPEAQKWLEGKAPRKVIVVPKKIVNIVL